MIDAIAAVLITAMILSVLVAIVFNEELGEVIRAIAERIKK